MNAQLLDEKGLKYAFFRTEDAVASTDQLREREVTEGDFLYVLGFPMGMVAKDRQHVVLRQGVIARIRDLFEGRNTNFVIDALVFPGNSGGPVILKPEMMRITGTKSSSSAVLIGIVKGFIPYQDVAISQQSKRPRIVFEENSGLTLVEPVDHILETIEQVERNKNVV